MVHQSRPMDGIWNGKEREKQAPGNVTKDGRIGSKVRGDYPLVLQPKNVSTHDRGEGGEIRW